MQTTSQIATMLTGRVPHTSDHNRTRRCGTPSSTYVQVLERLTGKPPMGPSFTEATANLDTKRAAKEAFRQVVVAAIDDEGKDMKEVLRDIAAILKAQTNLLAALDNGHVEGFKTPQTFSRGIRQLLE